MVPLRRHRDAIEVARAFAAERSPKTALLLILGSAGVGKTALVRQLVSDVTARGHRRCHIVTARDIAGRMVDAIRADGFSELACWFGRSDFVAIEDVSELCDRPATLEELARLTAGWVAHGARVVCTFACSVQTITEFERRLPPPPISRAVTLHKPTRNDMCEILRNLAAEAAVSIDRQSLTDLAAWCDGDIRRAVGAIRQLTFEATYAGRPN